MELVQESVSVPKLAVSLPGLCCVVLRFFADAMPEHVCNRWPSPFSGSGSAAGLTEPVEQRAMQMQSWLASILNSAWRLRAKIEV